MVEQLLEKLDGDHDGVLSRDELLEFVRAYTGDPTTTNLRDMEKFVGKKRKRVKQMIMRGSRQAIEKMHEAFICGFIDHE